MTQETTEREWVCSYRHDGQNYGLTVWATNPAEAARKLRSIGAWGRVDGELMETIHMPAPLGWLGRLYADLRIWWANRSQA